MKYIIALLIGLNIWDGLLTHVLVGNGIASEANPFLQTIVHSDRFLSFKLCGGILAVFLLWTIYTRWPTAALAVGSCFVIFYMVVVGWNLSLWLR